MSRENGIDDVNRPRKKENDNAQFEHSCITTITNRCLLINNDKTNTAIDKFSGCLGNKMRLLLLACLLVLLAPAAPSAPEDCQLKCTKEVGCRPEFPMFPLMGFHHCGELRRQCIKDCEEGQKN
ncbi:hypothetical protein Btru_030009 [Bulinus truncatus]|nr:hypothetical protein Btru_030009 [Bulinus truncatus]